MVVNEERTKEADATRIHGHCIVAHSKPVYEQNSFTGFSSSLAWKFIELDVTLKRSLNSFPVVLLTINNLFIFVMMVLLTVLDLFVLFFVVGCGPIGLLAIGIAKCMGAIKM